MLPYKFNFGEYQDKDQTKAWIDSLITKENLPIILAHYDFTFYAYKKVKDDPWGMPHYHFFQFVPKNKEQLTPEVMECVKSELFKKTLLSNFLEEYQAWSISNSKEIQICVKVMD